MASLTLLVVVVCLANLHLSLKDAEIAKVRAQVESAYSLAAANFELVQQGRLSDAEARERARDAIRSMNFDGGSRVFVFNKAGIRVVSNTRKEEGTSAWASPHTQTMIKMAENGGGVTRYSGARIRWGQETGNNPKAAWSQEFKPWGWVIASASYLDDVDHAFKNRLGDLGALLVVATLLIALIVRRSVQSIVPPLERMTMVLRQLAMGGKPEIGSDGQRPDEIGEMAKALATLSRYQEERQDLQAKLSALAYSDALTALPNLTQLIEFDRTEHAHAQDRALVLIDINRFKAVNDTLGHKAGDQILITLADRLRSVCLDRFELGRVGGDVFFMLIDDPEMLEALPQLIEDVLTALTGPFETAGAIVHLSASASFARTHHESLSNQELLQRADIALHHAKQSGRGHIAAYTATMASAARRRFLMEGMIREGLQRREFFAEYQAKFDIGTGHVIGAEALCRWHHPQAGRISPTEFIVAAEETGQIVALGTIMLEEACALASAFNRDRGEPFVVAVNVSARQLIYGAFVEQLQRCLLQADCHPSWLQLEITESVLLCDDDLVVGALETIVGLGVEIAIDDFGTGYSALSYLSRFPITYIKIDQSFVRGMLTDPQQQVLVRTIIAMAHGLGMKAIAEGVEDKATFDLLCSMGCDQGQGYYWHRPASGGALSALVQGQVEEAVVV
jgi:diguanylate cyclase (GGDEF)-like protein